MTSASTATSVVMASVPMAVSSSGRANPSGPPKVVSSEVQSNWPFARTASPSGLSRLRPGADCSSRLQPGLSLAFRDIFFAFTGQIALQVIASGSHFSQVLIDVTLHVFSSQH